MFRARRTFALVVAAASFAAAGCNTPDTVSKYCTASTTTLTTAVSVFEDFSASCLRTYNLNNQRIGTFSEVASDTGCSAIATQATAAEAAAGLLVEYFTAINSLATVGTAKSGTDAATLVSKTGVAAGGNPAVTHALSSIAELIVSASTGAYKQRSLDGDLVKVSDNIGQVTEALIKIVNLYENQLNEEDKALTFHYRSYASGKPADVVLTLDSRWRADEKTLAAKESAGYALIDALSTIRKCAAALATNGKSIKAKQLPALLDPYLSQLQTLIPQLQKVF